MSVITRDMIEDGLLQGIVTVCHEGWAGNNDGDLICKIGNGWFYIGNDIDETDYDEVVDSIIGTLDGFLMCLEYEDEYLYYYYYLIETDRNFGCIGAIMIWRELIDTVIKNVLENEMNQPALLFNYSMNNNHDDNFVKAVDVEQFDFEENPPRDFSIVFNSEDGF